MAIYYHCLYPGDYMRSCHWLYKSNVFTTAQSDDTFFVVLPSVKIFNDIFPRFTGAAITITLIGEVLLMSNGIGSDIHWLLSAADWTGIILTAVSSFLSLRFVGTVIGEIIILGERFTAVWQVVGTIIVLVTLTLYMWFSRIDEQNHLPG